MEDTRYANIKIEVHLKAKPNPPNNGKADKIITCRVKSFSYLPVILQQQQRHLLALEHCNQTNQCHPSSEEE